MGSRAQLVNNAITTLAAGIGTTDTSFTVAGGTGNLFPSTGYYYATIYDNSGNLEIVKVTTRAVDTFSVVVRAQEGTTARAFSSGSKVRLNATAGVLMSLADQNGDNIFTGTNTHSGVETFSNAASTFAGNAATATTAANATNLGGVAAANYAQPALNNTYTKAQRGAYTVLTDAATIAMDLSTGNMYRVQLGGNRTLGVPTNAVAGQSGLIDVYQDSTGSRTLSYAWCWQFPFAAAPVLSTAIRAKDKISYSVDVYQQSTVTISIASPGVITYPSHGLMAGQQVQLVTTGALPTGLVTNTTYFVVPIDANTFSLAATQTGAAIATSGSQAGVHTLTAFSITAALVRGVA